MTHNGLKYFKACSTLEQARKLHKVLVKCYHPDKSPHFENEMAEINAEFDCIKRYGIKGCSFQADFNNAQVIDLEKELLKLIGKVLLFPFKALSLLYKFLSTIRVNIQSPIVIYST